MTAADEASERVILEGLARLDPQTPVISEEAAAGGRIPQVGETFYLVDPLDGTKEFVSRNGEFTVNIARIENGVPVVGVVYAPAIGASSGAIRQKAPPRAKSPGMKPLPGKNCWSAPARAMGPLLWQAAAIGTAPPTTISKP